MVGFTGFGNTEPAMQRRQLPIGIQSFRTLREDGCYYVDKTPLIHRLVSQGRHYFLSRPRRFGKSLLLDTLGELFAGSEDLLRDLHIHDRWDWGEKHPVIRLSFDGKYSEPDDLGRSIHTQLRIIERNAGLDPAPDTMNPPDRPWDMLDRLHHKTGKQVVVLVDEYDKPILDVLDDPERAKANRDQLRGFYGVIKGCAHLVRFVFVTGISMFSKVSLFSGLNNLRNISLDPRYAAICGYTDRDLDTVFAPELPELDRDEIRSWYNGYHWRGGEKVYNPFDILLLFDSREFLPHWYETGTPTFLFETMMERAVSPLELENREAEVDLLSTFDVGNIDAAALMFQTGYLTITGEERRDNRLFFRLDFPNLEVRPLRGMVRGHALCVLAHHRRRPSGGGVLKPRPFGHGVAARWPGVRAGIQDGGRERGNRSCPRSCHGADPRPGLRRRIPRPRRADSPAGCGLRPQAAQPARGAVRTRLNPSRFRLRARQP